MKRTLRFAKSIGRITCELSPGNEITVPVVPGILKHPRPEELPALLSRPSVVRKYTMLALSKASWPILRQFPRAWLKLCLENARLKHSRRQALMFLLG